jgi:dipeptidase E
MMSLRILLLSNSTSQGGKYLELWSSTIQGFLAKSNATKVVFIPFAGVTIGWDSYTSQVAAALPSLNIKGIHHEADKIAAINCAEAIIIGGGNTFNLLLNLQKEGLVSAIRDRVRSGIPYIGWSAGSNVATPDIGTTNDMPVVWPLTQEALNLVPFNINPHYQNWKPPGFQGEGRDQRLDEAAIVKRTNIVALSEGIGILAEGSPTQYTLIKGPRILRPENSVLEVKIWKPTQDDKKFAVVEVELGDGDESVLLDPYLQ